MMREARSIGPSPVDRRDLAPERRVGRVEPPVEQMARRDVGQRLEQRGLHARVLAFELHQHPLDALALQRQVAAGRAAAADDGQRRRLRVRARLFLEHVGQRPDHRVPAVVGHQLGGHRLQGAGEEHVQQERLDEVVGVMSQRDLRGARRRSPGGTARRGAAVRTANTAWRRRRACRRWSRRWSWRCGGIPSRARRTCV